MHIISQLHLSTFDGGKSYNAEIRIGDKFYGVAADAVKVLLAEHKRLGGVVNRFPPRPVTIKNADRAAAFGRKVGDVVSVTDLATRTLEYDATIGDGVVSNVSNVALVTLAISGDDLDLGEVKEITVATKPATASVPADDDIA